MTTKTDDVWVAVTGSQDPYIFDLPHVLSLPPGFEFRFRYRHRWVQDEVCARLGDPNAFYNKDMILCFHSQDSRRVVPIRRCKIVSIEEIGPVIFLRFSVGDFPKLAPTKGDSDPLHATKALAEYGRALLGIADDADLSKPLAEGQYLRQAVTVPKMSWVDVPPSTDRDDGPRQSARARAWASLAQALSAETSLKGVPLFHLLGFDQENGAHVPTVRVKNKFSKSKTPIHGFELTEGDRYRMRLLEWCATRDGEATPRFRVDCDFEQAGLALEGASNLVVGRYDVLEFTFRAERPGYGEVLIKADPLPTDEARATSLSAPELPCGATSKPSRRWPTIYTARVPVSVSTPWWKLGGLALLVPLGLGVYIRASAAPPPYNTLLQVLGLLLLSPFAGRLEKLFKMREGFQKWSGGTEKTGKE